MNDKALYSTLAFAGVTPFLFCALLSLLGVNMLPPAGDIDLLANSYGLAIISFLAGIHWATFLYRQNEVRVNLMVTSNVVFLLAWFAFMLAPVDASLIVQFFALVVLLLIDRGLRARELIASHYYRVRLVATSLAGASLVAIVLT